MKIMATSGKSGTSNNPAGIPRTNSLGQDENNYTNYMKNIQKFGMSKTEWRMRGCPETQTSERNNTNYANWTHQEMNTTKPGAEKYVKANYEPPQEKPQRPHTYAQGRSNPLPRKRLRPPMRVHTRECRFAQSFHCSSHHAKPSKLCLGSFAIKVRCWR